MTAEKQRDTAADGALNDDELEDVAGGRLPSSFGANPVRTLDIYCRANCEGSGGRRLRSISAKDRSTIGTLRCPYCGGGVYTDGDV